MKKIAMLVWLSLTGCAWAQFTVQKVDIVKVSTPIAVSIATTSIVNVSGSTVVVQQPVDVSGSLVDVSGSVINDARWYAKVSTGSAGLLNATGNITINGYTVKGYSFYSDGGNTTITGNKIDGTVYALDGIPVGADYNISLSSPVVFQCTLTGGASLYWMASGEK